jgi:RNA polymerase sigma factor (sigma-70 family)
VNEFITSQPAIRSTPRRERRRRDWSDEPDAELVGHAATGDEDAWSALHLRYDEMVRAIARRTGCTSTAADVSQRTWELLLRSLSSLRDPSRVAGWLATTAKREALRELTRRVPAPVDVVELAETRLPWSRSPEAVVTERETVAAVERAVAILPTRYRPIVELMLRDDTPCYQDLAARLGRPVGSLGPMRGRGLRLVRLELERTGVC